MSLDYITKAVQQAQQERNIDAHKAKVTAIKRIEVNYDQIRTETVSEQHLHERRIISGLCDTEQVNSYKMLRTAVLQRLQKNGWNTFGVTSSIAGEGKTRTAINLSISLAMEGNHTVLLVDADLQRPAIHKYFGYALEKGLNDYLVGDTPIKDTLIHVAIGNLVTLPVRKPLQNSSGYLRSPKMATLVEEAKTRYSSRIVVFDLPPLLSTDDVIAFSPLLDSILLVIEDGAVTHEELARSAELLKDTNLLGTVLNKSKEKIMGYGPSYY
ncbi:tyrosine-protein kinase [Nitrosococcus halophilus Nc 4]|uniref:Tyrosine-protein kinase n=1 Tax=Nitrosococcus halophilus (strain Nc4) TaxID=472759 RepID=D5C0P9_NITHN|nr:CpsD/CapB family tyrosine-protein kinase [Nitrosococcus halophilus]ADE16372.1 tyrosine-protein kinase [Nitrosococcus halophilus Nc 4]